MWQNKIEMTGLIASGKVGPGGRIVIPAPMRHELGIEPGDSITLRIEDGDLRIVSRQAALRRIRERLKKKVPPGVSLADELIKERRAEAARE